MDCYNGLEALPFVSVDLFYRFAEEYEINAVVDAHISRGTSEDLNGKLMVHISVSIEQNKYSVWHGKLSINFIVDASLF